MLPSSTIMRQYLSVVSACLTIFPLTAYANNPELIGGLELPNTLASSCYLSQYREVTAYDTPGGLQIGALKIQNPSALNKPCTTPQTTSFFSQGSSSPTSICVLPLPSGKTSLCVYAHKSIDGINWYQGGTQYTKFWVKSTNAFHSLTKSLITGVSDYEESCSESACYASDYKLREYAEKASKALASPCETPYLLSSFVTLASGQKAYQLTLRPTLSTEFQGKLPPTLIVPVYKSNGDWTGFYDPEHCENVDNK